MKIDASLRKNVPFARAKEVAAAAHEAEGRVTAAGRELKKIPARHKNHPDVVALAKQIADAEAYVADLQKVVAEHERIAKEKDAAAESAQRAEVEQQRAEERQQQAAEAAVREQHAAAMSAFSTEYWKYKQDLEWFKPFAADPAYTLGYGDTTIAKGKAMFADLHAGCIGKHKEIANPANDWNKTYRWWCELAAQGDVILRRMVENWIRERERVYLEGFDKQADDLATCNGYLKYFEWDYYSDPGKVKKEWVARYAADAKAVGLELSEAMFTEADAALAALVPKIVEASKGWKFDPYGKPANGAWVKKQYEGLRGVKVLKIYHQDTDWRVYKNALGVNTHRTKRGYALLQFKGDPWCREATFTIVQDAMGRSGFGKNYFDQGPMTGGRVVSCK